MSHGTLKALVRLPSDPENSARPGRVEFLDNAVQNATGTVNLRATMSNPDRHFWPGQFVDVKLVLATQKECGAHSQRKPRRSASRDPLSYVIKAGRHSGDPPSCTLGQRQGSDIVIASGLAPGERVVLTGQLLVRPGSKVHVAASGAPTEPVSSGNEAKTAERGALMNLSELFIRRPVMTVALTASVLLFGVFAYLRLPVSDLPAVDYPVIQVQVNYPGATPETMANNVATPLERQFMQIPGLEMVTSNNGQGHSSFVLQFDLSKSLDGAATDVQAAITRATGTATRRSA